MAALRFKELGNAKYKEGKYEDAVEAYTKAIEADDTQMAFYGNRAAAFMGLKKYEEAIADCEKAIELDSSFLRAYIRAAKCYSQRGMIVEAKRKLNDCLLVDGACEEAKKEVTALSAVEEDLKKAQEHLGKNDYDRAGYYVDRVVPQCPDAPAVMIMRADLLIGRGKYDDAGSICWALLAKDRNNPDLMFLRGKALLYGGSTDKALKHFQEALRVDPDHARARDAFKMVKAMERVKTAGNDAFKAGNCAAAIEAYTEALGMDPLNTNFNATIYCNRAAAKMKHSQYKSALQDCDEALKLSPSYIKAVTRRGDCLLQLKQFEEAVREFEKATQMEPESNDYRARLRHAKLELKKSLRKDYYKILELSQDAGENDIKKAYKRAALKYHPDKWGNATDEEKEEAEVRFKDIGEAYALLSDPMKRRKYDAGQDLEEIEHGGGFGQQEMDPSQIFQMFMGGRGGMGGMGGMHGF